MKEYMLVIDRHPAKDRALFLSTSDEVFNAAITILYYGARRIEAYRRYGDKEYRPLPRVNAFFESTRLEFEQKGYGGRNP
jgi:hypothetical protein